MTIALGNNYNIVSMRIDVLVTLAEFSTFARRKLLLMSERRLVSLYLSYKRNASWFGVLHQVMDALEKLREHLGGLPV